MDNNSIGKRILEKYPIQIAELLAKLILEDKFDKAVAYCQEFCLEKLSLAIQKNNMVEIEDCLSDIWCGNLYDVNGNPEYCSQTIELITINEKYLSKEYRHIIYHVDEIINATNAW